ncbi:hypothetical protein Tco_1194764 [Tanacetum coccineum]
MHAPLQSHFDIGLRVLKYLKLAPGNGIEFSKSNDGFKVIAFFDSDWAKCPMTRRAIVSATCEVMWVLKILKDLGLYGLVPVTLFCDNKSAIEIATNPVMYEKTKHFNIDVHLVKQKVCHTPTVAETRDATIPFIAQDIRSYTLQFTITKLGFT